MRRGDFVVPVGADQQQMPHARFGDQMFEQVERRGIQPLKVIEKQCKRAFGPGKDTHEPAEYAVEPVSRILRGEIGNRRLRPDDELKLRDQLDHELSARAQRVLKGIPPFTDLRVALAKNLAHESLEGLRESGVRDVALVLVEFASGEET